LSEAIDRYLAYRRANYAKTTAENDASILRRWEKTVGDIQVRNLRTHHVDEWFFGDSGLRRTLTKPGSFNNYRKRLNSFVTYCHKAGWLKGDVMMNVRPQREMRRERLQLTVRELDALLDLARNPRDRAYLAININTALRASEIVGLLVGDADLEKGRLAVTVYKTHEQDNMPITSDLDSELRRWLTIYADDLGEPLHPRMRLIPARVGPRYNPGRDKQGGRTHRAGPWKPYDAIKNPANIVQYALQGLGHDTRGEGSHTLRRSLARIYFESIAGRGYDGALRATSALLHHKDTATTERYLGISVERELRDTTLLGQPFLSSLLAADDNVVPLHRSEGEQS
jgi:integrase